MSAVLDRPEKVVRFQLHRKLQFLMEMHPYKVAYGGRNSYKSWSFAAALLTLGLDQPLRVLCTREVQKSLADSVHQLLKDQIRRLDYGSYYDVTDNAIRGTNKDTLFRFTGLSDQTSESVKSYEGFDIAWVEEAQSVSKRSWQILLPTIFRTKNSEVWVSFNPGMDSDETWDRFVVNTPEGAKIVAMNWRDGISPGWWSDEQERLRQYDIVHSKDDYDNIWEGKPRTVVAGAIYAGEVVEMITEQRFRPIPYDPRLPVHCIWDLGWNDLMVAIMVQRPHPSTLNVINYLEESHITYANMLGAMDRLGYKWGTDWMPHDAEQHDPKSGTNAKKLLEGLGRNVRIIPTTGAEARVKAGRMMFPRVYMDNAKRDTPPERPDRLLGAGHLMERLKRYRRTVPRSTQEPAGPLHDIASHGADAWGAMAEIVDRIRNEGEIITPVIPAFRNFDTGMGLL